MKFITSQFPGSSLKEMNSYTDEHNGASHIYFKQVVNGLMVENGDVNVNLDRLGRVISFGESLFKGHSGTEKTDEPEEKGWMKRLEQL